MTDEPARAADPWVHRSSRPVYGNAWIDVREDGVERADGSEGIYGVVAFRNVALAVVPLFADGTTLLVGQHRYPLRAWSWEIPEGGGDPALDARAEAARELREETGLSAGRWTDLGTAHTSNSVTDEVARLFLAEDLAEGREDPDPTERIVVWRLPLIEAVRMAVDSRVTDALSVLGLLRVAAARPGLMEGVQQP